MAISRSGTGFFWKAALLAVAMLGMAAPASAQFSESYKFLKAVRDANGADATKSLDSPASTLINTRDYSTGESALHIVVKRRDMTWLAFLLGKGANADIRDNAGDTPLITAARLGFLEGANLLITAGATINMPNSKGETALIIATQLRNVPLVRALIMKGADPKQADRITGKSARDYATDDARSAAVLKMLDEAAPVKAKPKMSGPGL